VTVTGPDATGHFGSYGGRLAPEALMAALDELTAAYTEAMTDPVFQADLNALLTGYAGRPTLLTEAPRFAAQAGGCRVFLKREDLTHTGSHKINNVLGQALLTKRLGKTRIIARLISCNASGWGLSFRISIRSEPAISFSNCSRSVGGWKPRSFNLTPGKSPVRR